MIRLVLLLAGFLLVLSSATQAQGAAQGAGTWRMVCDHDATAQAPLCHVAIFAQDKSNGAWLAVAVQILNGSHEVQVTSSGDVYHSAEIDAEADTTTYTDYCYGSYCVFVHAEKLVERFKSQNRVNIRMFNGTARPSIERRVTLMGFTKAYEEYLQHIGE